mmetsp:Transcript_28792/g.42424  ORF Transcript_28792/g.42424 Transcript_28792/m.42424 type:complete len:121 (-) Transcript_28792:527-889(-)
MEVGHTLDIIVRLFLLLTDKDMFADIYRNQFSKQLLNQWSASNDAAKAMIAKLKVQCRTQFASKMEGMLNDLVSGSQLRSEFNLWLEQLDVKLHLVCKLLQLGTGLHIRRQRWHFLLRCP